MTKEELKQLDNKHLISEIPLVFAEWDVADEEYDHEAGKNCMRVLREVLRRLEEGEKAKKLIERISEIIDGDDGVYRIAGIERAIMKYQNSKEKK